MKNNVLRFYSFLVFCLLFAGGMVHAQAVIFPQVKQAGAAKAKAKNGNYILSNNLLTATFVEADGKLLFGGAPELGLLPNTELFKVQLADGKETPASAMKLKEVRTLKLKGDASAIKASRRVNGVALEALFEFGELDICWRAVLRNGSHYLRTEMELTARHDVAMHSIYPMLYLVDNLNGTEVPKVVGNTRGAVVANNCIFAGLETPTGLNSVGEAVQGASPIQGLWSRQTTLQAGKCWQVSAVVGLIAKGQPRRSFLAYSERERAVPWRAMPVYISWYELNIDRNNDRDYATNMTAEQCTDVVKEWKKQFFDKYGVGVKAFVWDDGWDSYGTWTFNKNFPNGLTEPDAVAREMGSGMGAWLGPVGGYGQSGEYRRGYWKEKGGMQLSNPDYYKVFLDACSYMINHYDFRFFKFDGISAQFSAVGPDPGSRGEENAEAIINIERETRKIKEDIFLNTTVGTWASPFWFQFTDAVWRQEADHSTIGDQGHDRERWITYRDRLVYQNFVQNSPFCPINTLMTHGFILTRFGDVSKNMEYDGILRELRCAFACGSGMVELYNDYKLMNEINGGQLWKDLADCVKWQEANADVLPDIHWVGGNPWDGKKANIYGWAAWNGKKAVLTLRNPAASPQSIKLTLRQALEIPAYVKGCITLSDGFSQQALQGLPTGTPIDIDKELTIEMPASTVYIYNGQCK
ncbi:MAG: hypothetical protein ACI4CA_07045 [Bacteroides sp.]